LPPNSQDNWRWCSKCQSLAFAGGNEGICPAGGKHDQRTSYNYVLQMNVHQLPPNSQDNWRWCSKCQSLAFAGGNEGICPAGGKHDHSMSGNYVLQHNIQHNIQEPTASPFEPEELATETYNLDGAVVLAFVCKRIPKSPNPDNTLEWTS